jgi:hypothetical protein
MRIAAASNGDPTSRALVLSTKDTILHPHYHGFTTLAISFGVTANKVKAEAVCQRAMTSVRAGAAMSSIAWDRAAISNACCEYERPVSDTFKD